MSTKPARKHAKLEALCAGTYTEEDLRRYAVFDHNDRFVGLKPGVRSEDIDPNWRSRALSWAYVICAIGISREAFKPDRARKIAEAMALEMLGGVFAVPHYESTEKGERLCFGQFWYLTEQERDDTFHNFYASLDNPQWADTLEAIAGINKGLEIIEMFAHGLRTTTDPEKLKIVRSGVFECITTNNKNFLDEPLLREALEVIISNDSFSRKGRLTHDLAIEASSLYAERHKRIQTAKKDYTTHKRSAEWAQHVALEDKKRPGKPKIPASKIAQFPEKSPREIALEWVAEEMNKRHADLGATANTIRGLVEAAHKAEIQTINGDDIG